jgi:type IV secretory pathway VirB3-like protein
MSRKLTAAATAAALIAGISLAHAAQTETGVIASINAKAPSITLQKGAIRTFWLASSVNPADLKVGEKVVVTYDMISSKPTASAVVQAH